jgi:hypothetical protein
VTVPTVGARIAGGCLLLNGDRRGKTINLVDIRLLHHFQELAGISAQAFHIPPLAFRIDGIEGEGRLARARQSGHHDQLVSRQIEIDVFQIVFAGTADAEHLGRVILPAVGVRGLRRRHITCLSGLLQAAQSGLMNELGPAKRAGRATRTRYSSFQLGFQMGSDGKCCSRSPGSRKGSAKIAPKIQR